MNHSRFIQSAATVLALVVTPALGHAQTRSTTQHAGDKSEWLHAHPHAPRSMPRTALNDDWKQAWSSAHPNQQYPANAAANQHATNHPNTTHSSVLPLSGQNLRRGGGPSSTYDFGTGYDFDTLNHGAANDLNRSDTSPNRSMDQGNTDSMPNSDTAASGVLVTGGGMR